jgi:hypothetical protein
LANKKIAATGEGDGKKHDTLLTFRDISKLQTHYSKYDERKTNEMHFQSEPYI